MPATRAGSPAGKQKYNAQGERVDGIFFASEAEAERYRQLKDMQAAEKIANLKTQARFPLVVNNATICTYVADFTYDVIDQFGRTTRAIVEDVKGMETPEFKLKAKLFNALMPTPLSIIHVKGAARHSTRPKIGKSGRPVSSRAGWIDLHWKNRLPD